MMCRSCTCQCKAVYSFSLEAMNSKYQVLENVTENTLDAVKSCAQAFGTEQHWEFTSLDFDDDDDDDDY